jgi:FtsP/CotA-like multicopper oxidase with cupredoxin domain
MTTAERLGSARIQSQPPQSRQDDELKSKAPSTPGRRAFLKLSGMAALGAWLDPAAGSAAQHLGKHAPTHVLHIREAQVELAPGRSITTTTYDAQLPGPLLRATVGQRVRVDVYNETDHEERINWHGQNLPVDEATRVPARSMGRMEFTPEHPGLYLYHSNLVAAGNLGAGSYSGQSGGLLVQPAARTLSRCERECPIILKEYEPYMRRTQRGCEVGYRSFTINGRLPGEDHFSRGDAGRRVLVQILNASATETRALALDGHSFEVIALDGNPVPVPTRVRTLQLSPGERISARIELRRPGGWLVRDLDDTAWSYSRFSAGGRPPKPDRTLELVLARQDAARSGFNRWSINGRYFSASRPQPLFRLQRGLRYRLKVHNSSDEIVPLHLQNHRLEIVRLAGRPTAGILKDVVSIGAGEALEVDFVADHPGPALLYCTRQFHKDFGLMALLDYT